LKQKTKGKENCTIQRSLSPWIFFKLYGVVSLLLVYVVLIFQIRSIYVCFVFKGSLSKNIYIAQQTGKSGLSLSMWLFLHTVNLKRSS